MQKHFITFYSPGTLFCETTEKPISSWDVTEAKKMAKGIKERYDACPFGFQFTTRTRGEDDLDSKVTATSPLYYLGGKVETAEEVLARATPADNILCDNIRINGYKRIITNTNSWQTTRPLNDDDVVLEWP